MTTLEGERATKTSVFTLKEAFLRLTLGDDDSTDAWSTVLITRYKFSQGSHIASYFYAQLLYTTNQLIYGQPINTSYVAQGHDVAHIM